jgi:hypothetical protein
MIEKLENQNRELRLENQENNELIKKGISQPGVPVMAHRYPLDESLKVTEMQQSFLNKMEILKNNKEVIN